MAICSVCSTNRCLRRSCAISVGRASRRRSATKLSMSASFLARSSASVTDTLAWRAVLSENWLEVERLVSCPHFEANADRSVGVADQPASAQHTGPKIDRRAVENDDLHGMLQTPLKVGFEIEWPGVEGRRRRDPVQDTEIDVAVGTGHVPRDAAKDIHSADAVVIRVEKVRCSISARRTVSIIARQFRR
jgi:hypothetical protein